MKDEGRPEQSWLNKEFLDIAVAAARMVDDKNIKYGDSFRRSGEILKILFPDGIQPHQYLHALAIVRVIDKLFRIANGNNAWADIIGYGILGTFNEGGLKKSPDLQSISPD